MAARAHWFGDGEQTAAAEPTRRTREADAGDAADEAGEAPADGHAPRPAATPRAA